MLFWYFAHLKMYNIYKRLLTPSKAHWSLSKKMNNWLASYFWTITSRKLHTLHLGTERGFSRRLDVGIRNAIPKDSKGASWTSPLEQFDACVMIVLQICYRLIVSEFFSNYTLCSSCSAIRSCLFSKICNLVVAVLDFDLWTIRALTFSRFTNAVENFRAKIKSKRCLNSLQSF